MSGYLDTVLLTKRVAVNFDRCFWCPTQVNCSEVNKQRKPHRKIVVIQSHLASTMKHWLFETLLLFLAAYQANGAKITNSTNSAHAQTDGETVVCNQYIETNIGTNDAIKKLDEKLDQIITLLQPSPNPSKIIAFKNILHLETDKYSFLLDYKLKNEQNDTTKASLEKFRSFSFLSFFLSLLFLFCLLSFFKLFDRAQAKLC